MNPSLSLRKKSAQELLCISQKQLQICHYKQTKHPLNTTALKSRAAFKLPEPV